MLATLGLRPLRLPAGMIKVGADLLDGLAGGTAAQHGVQQVVGDDWRAAAVFVLAGGASMIMASGSGLRRARPGHRPTGADQASPPATAGPCQISRTPS
jgi:hypothetical protein